MQINILMKLKFLFFISNMLMPSLYCVFHGHVLYVYGLINRSLLDVYFVIELLQNSTHLNQRDLAFNSIQVTPLKWETFGSELAGRFVKSLLIQMLRYDPYSILEVKCKTRNCRLQLTAVLDSVMLFEQCTML